MQTPPLAQQLPRLNRSGAAQLPTDPEALNRRVKNVLHQARRGGDYETAQRLSDLLAENVTDRVEKTLGLVMDDSMQAVAFVFEDCSVYVLIRVPSCGLSSFAAPDLWTARTLCAQFHPGHVPPPETTIH